MARHSVIKNKMMNTKRIVLYLMFLLSCSLLRAQQPADSVELELPYPAILVEMPNARVVQDSMVTLLMQEKIAGVTRGVMEMQGFRVQVYSSNMPSTAKQEAMNLEQNLRDSVDVPVYVLYTPPFWKVRLGDFRTMEDAKQYKDTFVVHFPQHAPETYIVRDKIQIKR